MAGMRRKEQKLNVISLTLPHKLDIDMTAIPIQNKQPRCLGFFVVSCWILGVFTDDVVRRSGGGSKNVVKEEVREVGK